jgi:hypothetical protein
MTMADLIGWFFVAFVLSLIVWGFWPLWSRALRITANEGDELMSKLPTPKQAKKSVKKLAK